MSFLVSASMCMPSNQFKWTRTKKIIKRSCTEVLSSDTMIISATPQISHLIHISGDCSEGRPAYSGMNSFTSILKEILVGNKVVANCSSLS
ncbi:hypothetical protein AQUCO_01100197v1 [Aquilegia coerulea]|uniref:Uncharacterized protein n=1 Tax=Aquilegia coerulea TaxID=218851 RepID=A0A2G5E620_AQUCA|nr:hypothetical protein AQUCO_01100197v1 [Aquilegia coerulea]